MAKVLTFSTQFPPYHPRAGEPTHFVEKIWKSMGAATNGIGIPTDEIEKKLRNKIKNYFDAWASFTPKHHTIRAGNRWKVGDEISMRIWEGKPYRSKQIEFARARVEKVWKFELQYVEASGFWAIWADDLKLPDKERLAINDGLTFGDMFSWFVPDGRKDASFYGQIICWNPKVEY